MAVITSGPGTFWISPTASTTGSSTGTWSAWSQGWSQAGTTSTWIQWNTSYNTGYTHQAYGVSESQEQRTERSVALVREASERMWRERAAARERAEELLVALLSPEQEQTWREQDWFTVRGSRTGRTYRIRRGYAGNVDLLDADGHAEVTYCAHPPDVPAEDADIAQMLALVTDEDAFLAVANVTSRRRRHLQAALPALREAEPALQAVA